MNKISAIEKSWKKELKLFLGTGTFLDVSTFIENEYLSKKVYPEASNLFKAFYLTPFSRVKVVILGQDPYHGAGQAMGLSFSVPSGAALPQSLRNIYKEIESDLGIKKNCMDGNLEAWATQGVFLLNTVLSVLPGSPASHKGKGWEEFTDTVIKKLSDKHENIVFILWGNFARSKKNLIDTTKHLVLEAPHPSPFSAYTGFFGCQHFSQCNSYLKKHNKNEIVW